MKYAIIILTLATTLCSVTAFASDKIPFGNQLIAVQNYSRATPQIAISGLIRNEGVQALAAHNFKTIIDMRTAAEGTDDEKSLVEAANMRYINIPVSNDTGISTEQLAAFTKAIESAEKPVLLHCGSGNRAGAMWASYRISKGIEPEKALEEGRKAGMRPQMEEKVRAVFLN
ncbi:MAG: protein tyrosine phosphatase family protein [Pseudomonadota bacterium]